MNAPEERICEYYQSQKLSSSAIAMIREEGKRLGPQANVRSAYNWLGAISTAAAILLIVFSLQSTVRDRVALVHRSELAEQIVASHTAHPPDDFGFEVKDFGQLQTSMTQLQFALLPAESGIKARFDLEGARYCSVGGHVACHFVVRDRNSGSRGSLYVVPLDHYLARVSPGLCVRNDVKVEMWDDGARFYSFASNVKAGGRES